MTAEEIITWLTANKDYLKITAIGRDAGVPHLRHIIGKYGNAEGYTTELNDKYVPELNRIIEKIRNPCT